MKPHKAYRRIFDEISIAGSKNLIIDLRGNRGGRREFVAALIPYLLKEKRSGPWQESVSWKGKKNSYKIPQPSKRAFEGEVYVLVNGGSFSNGSIAAMLARELGDATIIGEESGGRYEGVVAGSSHYLMLPNMRLGVRIPRYAKRFPIITKQTTKGRGVIPDYEVRPSIGSVLGKKDIVLTTAYNLIFNKQKSQP